MNPSRPRVIAVLAFAAAVVAWLIVRLTYASLPPLPWTMMPSLLLLALGETYVGLITRARIQRRPNTKPMDPIAAARLAALAKASSHGAAVLGGIAAGLVIYLGGALDKPVPRSDFYVSLGTAIACGLLVAAALFLEHCCRIPNGPQRIDRPDDIEWDPSDHA